MQPFAYARTDDLSSALSAASAPGTAVLAGGTELLNWMRLGVCAPERIVDISPIAELRRIDALAGGGLRIGAMVRLTEAAAEPRVAEDWPVLREAIHMAASAQLRNLATVPGNLLQKTRCAYFRSEDPVACNRRIPDSGCAALDAINDRHAIFGWTDHCVATQPSDPAVALAALDAMVLTEGAEGPRRIPVRSLHRLPDGGTESDTVLERGELIVAVELPASARRSAYVKVRERASYEYALVSAAATLELDGGVICQARIALGSVALRPWRLDAAESQLIGLRIDSPDVEAVLDGAMAEARPLARNAFKVKLARNAALRALRAAAGLPERRS